jgi:hypothetical protein
MRLLVACEHSGVVREAFAALGHEAWSVDLLPSLQPGNHIQGDALAVLGDGWDLLIAHPPCQYLSYAGMAHWNKPGRAEKRQVAYEFFLKMVNAPVRRVCVENPRGLPCQAYRQPDQVIHPYMFGDPALKRTCLWLRGLPALWWWDQPGSMFQPTACAIPEALTVEVSGKRRHFVETGSRDPLLRSRTFPAVAAAMAAQWGVYE